MPETTTTALPVLPLHAGVVGPAMVVTIALDSDEAQVAADAALGAIGRLLLVPQVDGRSARIGTVAKIEDIADLPGGRRAVVVRGLHRARVMLPGVHQHERQHRAHHDKNDHQPPHRNR